MYIVVSLTDTFFTLCVCVVVVVVVVVVIIIHVLMPQCMVHVIAGTSCTLDALPYLTACTIRACSRLNMSSSMVQAACLAHPGSSLLGC